MTKQQVLALVLVVAVVALFTVLVAGSPRCLAVSAPVASLQSIKTIYVPDTVWIDASQSSGIITSYQIKFGDGTANCTSPTIWHTYNTAGNYTVILTVTGPGGSSSTTATCWAIDPYAAGIYMPTASPAQIAAVHKMNTTYLSTISDSVLGRDFDVNGTVHKTSNDGSWTNFTVWALHAAAVNPITDAVGFQFYYMIIILLPVFLTIISNRSITGPVSVICLFGSVIVWFVPSGFQLILPGAVAAYLLWLVFTWMLSFGKRA